VSLIPTNNANSGDGLRPISELEGDGQKTTTTTTSELSDINLSLITDDPYQDNQSTDDFQRTTKCHPTTQVRYSLTLIMSPLLIEHLDIGVILKVHQILKKIP
jgi:hypothetical protein